MTLNFAAASLLALGMSAEVMKKTKNWIQLLCLFQLLRQRSFELQYKRSKEKTVTALKTVA